MQTFYHAVHFWLKPDLSNARRLEFLAGLQAVAQSPNVASCRVGVPAGTPRAVVDNSYDFQLLCTFESQAAHDVYQSPKDVAHTAFIEGFKDCWAKVLIYDSLEA